MPTWVVQLSVSQKNGAKIIYGGQAPVSGSTEADVIHERLVASESSAGEKTAASCTICAAGYACPLGSIKPTPCFLGSYSDEGASECEACQIGHYCDKEGMTYDEMLKNVCEAGTSCHMPGVSLAWHASP